MDKYNVAVIGGGPGGYIAAIRAAQLGQKTILFEDRDLGGTCLNRGCIPTKALLHTSNIYEEIKQAAALGLHIKEATFDIGQMVGRKDGVVGMLRRGVGSLLASHGVQVVNARASFLGKNTIVADGKQYNVENTIIATGSEPATLPIPGWDKHILNSDDVLELTEYPDSIVIIGGGVIGIEFATLFYQLEKQVTIIEMAPGILPGVDKDICKQMTSLLWEKGVTVHTDAKVLEFKDGKTCIFDKNGVVENVTADAIIVAAGRKPVTAGLGLHEIGVSTENGFITVNDKMQTNIDGIYAIGDVTGKVALAHVASAQGIVAAHNTTGNNRVMSYDAVPACIYTSPEIASVGLTDQEAIKQGIQPKIGVFSVQGNGRSLASNCTRGFAKVVSEEETGRIIGCHIMSENATEIIAEAVVAIANKLTVEQLANTIHAHPTVSEIVMEAAFDTQRLSCNKPKVRK